MERVEHNMPRAVQNRRQEQPNNNHAAADRDSRHYGVRPHHRCVRDAEGHSGEDSRGRRRLHTGYQT